MDVHFKMTEEERQNKIDRLLNIVGLNKEHGARFPHELSGGQRQRVWIAMALAQKTDIIFLDEPTTYLDISHQLEILELVQHLNKELGCTIVMVLHDINQAIRFSDYLLIMKEGHIIDNGPTDQVLSKEILESVFNIDAVLGKDPRTGKPLLVTYNLLEKR